ncbi:hypothetical protein IMG5_076940 [Ichthyophthirius multifiliis]|uniref:Uncharacterized protein n=1 Tax=Ichthyophthirius multifiliis TaxID=5932 RepID=G0QQD1_ICHMU|nr:hypothetical protein IMG5_076940 [Ichthyophthirius multifiliis]EGR32574.1 hypothetical protein IMG5_076940 [Ichthyophthirius multifiliis]|eukprot:XP_004036560.1 hypothetical protein IMG5_076940 [Ichthyophthirius multifiliis]
MRLSLQKKTTKKKINEEEEEDNPELYKPRPELIQEEDQDENKEKKGIYQVPKLQAVLNKDNQIKEKEKIQEKRRQTYLKRKLAENLSKDIDEFKLNNRPIVERFGEKDKLAKQEKERISFEESNYIRLPVTKKDKFRQKNMEKKREEFEKIDDLQELKDIRELLYYEGLANNEDIQKKELAKVQKSIKKYTFKTQKRLKNKK